MHLMTQNIAVLPVLYLMQNIIALADFFSFDPSYQNRVVFRDVPYIFGKSPGTRGQNTSCENCSFTSRFFDQTRKTGHALLKTLRSSKTKMERNAHLQSRVYGQTGVVRGGTGMELSQINPQSIRTSYCQQNTTIESDNDDICSLLYYKAFH